MRFRDRRLFLTAFILLFWVFLFIAFPASGPDGRQALLVYALGAGACGCLIAACVLPQSAGCLTGIFNKLTDKGVWLFAAALFFVLIAMAGGQRLHADQPERYISAARIARPLLETLTLVKLAMNVLCSLLREKRQKKRSFLQDQRQSLAELEKYGKNPARLQWLRRRRDGGAVLLALMGLGLAFFCGAPLPPLGSAILLVWAAIVLSAALNQARLVSLRFIPVQWSTLLPYDEFPLLYDMAGRAAREAGVAGGIAILAAPQGDINTAYSEGRFMITFNIHLLNALNQTELYAAFLREFAMHSAKNRAFDRATDYEMLLNLEAARPSFLAATAGLFFRCSTERFHRAFALYSLGSRLERQLEADRAMAGHAEAGGSLLLKLEYYSLHCWESFGRYQLLGFSAEEPQVSDLTAEQQRFEAAIAARRADWDQIIAEAILPYTPSHPAFRARLAALGLAEAPDLMPGPMGDFAGELRRSYDFLLRSLTHEHAEAYARERENRYFTPLIRVTEWKEAGKPLKVKEYYGILNDLLALNEAEEAQALCARAMETFEEPLHLSPARFFHGAFLLHRWDESGLDFIYQAMYANHL